jgi:hypothetical protein
MYCELTTHESNDCPLLSMPKPVAVTYGVSCNDLMFHEVPASAFDGCSSASQGGVSSGSTQPSIDTEEKT